MEGIFPTNRTVWIYLIECSGAGVLQNAQFPDRATRPGDWKSYLRWHAIHANATSLSSAVYVIENFNFFGKTLQGQEQLPPRWKRCTNDVDDDLGEALGQVYVEKYSARKRSSKCLKIVQGIL